MCVDGVDMKPLIEVVNKGVYIVVAKLGRLKYMLAKKLMNLENCSELFKKGYTTKMIQMGCGLYNHTRYMQFVVRIKSTEVD
ncbi:hypothetical protein P3L10_025765 [Capsicum annuum]